ncbi:MAG: GHKL domain-containing protein [Clostridia bacterium]|nr:GHKL domain-containing protein [Clostridia bacterium]
MDFIKPLTAIIFCLTAGIISDIKIKKLNFLLWTIASYIVVGVSLLYSRVLSSAAIFVLMAIMIRNNGNKLVSGFNSAMFAMIIMIIADSVASFLLKKIYIDIDFQAQLRLSWQLFAQFFIIEGLIAIMFSVTMRQLLHKKMHIKESGKVDLKVLIVFFVTTMSVFVFMYATAIKGTISLHPQLIIIYIVFFLFLIIFTYFVFNTTFKERRLEHGAEEMKRLEEYTANIESMYRDIRSIRHDYSNVISSMIGYLDENDMNGLREYFKNEIVPFAGRMETADNNMSVLSRVKDPSLKGVLAVKIIRAQENNIPVKIDINEDIKIKTVEILDINRIVGILLDNAVEAASECEKPYVDIGFVKSENTLIIAIVNSTLDRSVNLRRIFEPGFSTKGEGRGIGLANVSEILSKYKNILLDTSIERNEFKQVIHIDESIKEE